MICSSPSSPFIISFHLIPGYYYYTEVTGANTGDKFCFVTQPFKGDKGKCLKFWYHMEGANIGTLNVYTRAYGGGDHKLWTKTGR